MSKDLLGSNYRLTSSVCEARVAREDLVLYPDIYRRLFVYLAHGLLPISIFSRVRSEYSEPVLALPCEFLLYSL